MTPREAELELRYLAVLQALLDGDVFALAVLGADSAEIATITDGLAPMIASAGPAAARELLEEQRAALLGKIENSELEGDPEP